MLKTTFALILFLFLSSCGYKAIHSKKNNSSYDFSISELSFIGDRNIDTIQLGERGSKISGGERQRIALARALFKKASLIVFDEATNALDKKVEREIFEIIYQLDNITIIVISHDTQNLYGCDKMYEIKNKNLQQFEID